ncbi:hypothetical protein ACFQGT_01960 [Natrialbaceae archaeon GCM10025810]|uniref:DUF7577 domain-containing protein n=1 Tax=Halovalidus salilacus TaxID=3075124 RepID=UPI003610B851
MELWGWLVGYVVLFALLHVLLYYFYVRRTGDDRTAQAALAGPDRLGAHTTSSDRFTRSDEVGDPEELEERLEFDGETITCPHCGARNEADPTFTYCWNCISALRR